MNVVMIGSGYVGLVSGTCFADFGANVTCIDINQAKIDGLNNGVIPIYEPGLETLVEKNKNEGRLSFSSEYTSEIIGNADLIFIGVGTPPRKEDGRADLSYVYQAARDMAPYLENYTVIINKSTVPVGTARQVEKIIREDNPDADFSVASNPEFLREGAAIKDFMIPDRVVIGVEDKRAEILLRELYRPLNLIETPILLTNLESAELIKYASNAFLATKISFINEMSSLCETVGADVHAIAKGMGLDGRIGRKFLHAGPGYGGSCFPKDTQALVHIAQDNGVSCRIVEAVIGVNNTQKTRMVEKIIKAMGNNLTGKKIAVLGLTFKPETDDMRAAPSLAILPALVNEGAIITAIDPKGLKAARKVLPDSVSLSESYHETVQDADAVILMTEWHSYRGLDLVKLKAAMKGNVFIDLRNVYEPEQMKTAGFDYHCVGR